jgi:hypothetical protein
LTDHHDGGAPHTPGPAGFAGADPHTDDAGPGDAATVEDPARRRQAGILRKLAERLEDGETALPTDVFALLVRELDLRDDDAAIAEAWTEQGEREAEPWVFCRGRAQG